MCVNTPLLHLHTAAHKHTRRATVQGRRMGRRAFSSRRISARSFSPRDFAAAARAAAASTATALADFVGWTAAAAGAFRAFDTVASLGGEATCNAWAAAGSPLAAGTAACAERRGKNDSAGQVSDGNRFARARDRETIFVRTFVRTMPRRISMHC